jgi:glycosyltransferase involved in cell wall biosynthesis
MKKNPTVSVVIPTYNREQLIGRSIKSVLSQTYQDFEIIVVDDASTDNTKEVINSFNDDRIRYVRHKQNRGEATARNTGIKVARGEYIASQDSDDVWFPQKLAKQIELLQNTSPKVGVAYTGFWKIENNEKTYIPFSWVNQKEGDIHRELLKGNFIGSPATLIKKECFKKVGMFDERLFHLVDWEMWLRVSKYYHFKFIDEPLLVAHYDSDNVSTNQNEFIKSQELILKKHFEDFSKDKELLVTYYIYIGDLLISKGDVRKGRSYLTKALKLSPFSFRALSAALLTFFGRGAYRKVRGVYKKIKK